jgi:outer membrane protein assembly factor BamB
MWLRKIYFALSLTVICCGISALKKQEISQTVIKPLRIVTLKNWTLDIDALKLVTSISERKIDTVWNINQEPNWRSTNPYRKTTTFIEANGDTAEISAKYKIDNNTIHNYVVSLTNKKSGKVLWEYSPKNPLSLGQVANAIRDGDHVYICIYSFISTGSDLVCLNFYSGKEVWHADVKQLNVEHSKYYNDVYLKLVDDKIIFAGVEAGGQYLQVIDKNTGKNLFAELQ